MATTEQLTTAKQLLETPNLGRCELVRGERIMMSPAGFEHGMIVMRVSAPLATFVEDGRLGVVTGAETGFLIQESPDTVRAPDVGFVISDRVPHEEHPGFFRGAPDLAVEVLSPRDGASALLAKIHQWLDSGCREVWVVDPKNRTVSIHRSKQRIDVLAENDTLTGGDLLPGFRLSVAEVFRPPKRP
ncbi:MAG: Uma2 family endonuclease [Pirellulales bacterium]